MAAGLASTAAQAGLQAPTAESGALGGVVGFGRRFSNTTRASGGDSWATVDNCPFEAERQAKAQEGIQTATFALG